MKQICLFDFPQVQVDKPIRLIELFGGIGSQAMALRDIGADFEHYRLVEFDKYAVASYNAIHGTDFETTDICDVHGADLGIVEKDRYCYLLTYSFPCTDLSLAGKMQGMSKSDWEAGHSTHSGLLWEVERILKELPKEQLPDVLLMENVPQVHAEQNKADFDNWLAFLRKRGYQNFYKDLNARDYGIPQNRERCFCVSVLADDFIDYEFPNPIPLEKVMKDYLEENIDDKYYINNEKANKLVQQLLKDGVKLSEQRTIDLCVKNPGEITVANCISARTDRGISNRQSEGSGVIERSHIDELNEEDRGTGFAGNVWDKSKCCPTITTMQGGGREPMIIEETKCIGGLSETTWGDKQYHQQDRVYKGDIALAHPANLPGNSYKYVTEEKQIQKVGQISNEGSQCGTVVSDEGLSPTLSAGTHGYANPHVLSQFRIRKLTPKECWRLMGYTDDDFDRAAKVNSNTQLYKEAGNAIVKQVLMAIFSQMNIQGVKPWNEELDKEIDAL